MMKRVKISIWLSLNITIAGFGVGKHYYNTWSNNEPNNAGGKENCGSQYLDGKLNDLPCTNIQTFICQRADHPEINDLTDSGECILVLSTFYTYVQMFIFNWNLQNVAHGYTLEPISKKRFKFFTEHSTWPEARTLCRREGGQLAVIESSNEKDLLLKMFTNAKNAGNIPADSQGYLGYHDIFKEGLFFSVDGMLRFYHSH